MALTAWAAGIACGVLAYVNRTVSVGDLPNLEGAYFEGAPGTTAYASVFDGGSWFDPFRFGNPYLWLGAAVAFAVMGSAILVVSRLSAGR
jgi:hypothetical protein